MHINKSKVNLKLNFAFNETVKCPKIFSHFAYGFSRKEIYLNVLKSFGKINVIIEHSFANKQE